jgi:hypothetical protein
MKRSISILFILMFVFLLCAYNLEAQTRETETVIVYITKTGARYHKATCGSLRSSKIPIELETAIKRGFTPCGTCKP